MGLNGLYLFYKQSGRVIRRLVSIMVSSTQDFIKELLSVSTETAEGLQEYNDILRRFRTTLEMVTGVRGWSLSKREALWAKAWEDGHADGLHGVDYQYNKLVEFAKKFLA